MGKRSWHVYTLSDPRTQEVRYVGITFRGKQRYNEHLSRALTGGRTHRDCWIRSLVAVGVRPVYQVVETGLDIGWQDAERTWIATYRATRSLVNHTDGGEGTPGLAPSLELRRKLSETRKGVPYPPGRKSATLGRHHTPEAIAKIQAASKGHVMPESIRAKLSALKKGKPLPMQVIAASVAARLGKPLTQEHKNKIGATTLTRKPVLCVETGEIFPSVKSACKTLSVPNASVNQAIRKGCRCKGLHLRFV